MVALAVIGGIFLLILLVLVIPVRVAFSYESVNDRVSLKAYFLFLRFNLSPDALAKLTEKQAIRYEKKAEKQKQEEIEKETGDKPPLDTLGTVLDLLREAGKPFGKIRRHIVFYRVRLYFLVCGENAHDTAMRYAGFSNVVFALLALLGSTFVLKSPTVFLSPDFTGVKSRHDISFRVRIQPLFALTGVIHLLMLFLKSRKNRSPLEEKGDNKQKEKVFG